MKLKTGENDVAIATVQALTAQFIKQTIQDTGLQPSVVMAGALSQVAATIAACYGGDQAANFLNAIARDAAQHPNMADLDLTDTPAAGRA